MNMGLWCIIFGHSWAVNPSSVRTLPKVTYDCVKCGKTHEKIINPDDLPDDSLLKFCIKLERRKRNV